MVIFCNIGFVALREKFMVSLRAKDGQVQTS
jgi:hypothetical protein